MEEIKQLLEITKSLRKKYEEHGRNFTLDGRLVGDIGEVLAAEKYGLELLPENTPIHDSIEKASGRKIQIKSSFKGYFYFPCGKDNVPNFFLCIVIKETGTVEEIFNGPGQFIVDNYVERNRLSPFKETYYKLSKGILAKLNKEVDKKDKIKLLPEFQIKK